MVSDDGKALLTEAESLPASFCAEFHTDSQIAEHTGIAPLNVSTFEGYEQHRAEFIIGALALGFPESEILPQQWVIADMLGAADPDGIPWHLKNVVFAGRRSTKSAAVFMVAVGRCLTRSNYKVVLTAQTGVKARERFLEDIVAPLEATYSDPKTAPFTINHGQAGTANIVFKNGSKFTVQPPQEAAFRGNAADMAILDEAQEFDATKTGALLRGIMPNFATRTKLIRGELKVTAQLVLTGTAGEHKSGMLWDTLELGRAGEAGIVEYAAPATVRLWREGEPIEGTSKDPEVWKLAHPGLFTLIPLAFLEEESKAPQEDFAREWLGLWPDAVQNSFLDLSRWLAMGSDDPLPEPPRQFGLAEIPHRGQTSGSIAVAWYVGDKCHVGLLAHRDGVRWIADEAAKTALRYGVPITLNMQEGASKMVADEFALMSPKPKLNPLVYTKVAAAAELFVSEFNLGNIVHYNDLDLNEAVPRVRQYTKANQRFWSFTSDNYEDITAVEAVALAMAAAKNQPERKPLPKVTLAR